MKLKEKYILLADDDLEDQEMLREAIIQDRPFTRIISVQNGREVLDYLATCAVEDLPSMIILDYKMPFFNAADILEVIGNDVRYKSIPKIVWSTSQNIEHVETCLQRGAIQYFSKPALSSELKLMLQKVYAIFDSHHTKE